MKLQWVLTASLATLALTAPAQPLAAQPAHTAAEQRADAAFAKIAERYIAAYTRLNPTDATTLGEHRWDASLSDVSTAGRAARAAEWRTILAELGKVDRRALSRENQVDYALLDNQLRYSLWSDDRLQPWRWDPQIYNSIASDALYGLAARDFAPWPQRLKAATARMEALPALLAEARRQLDPARVPKIHAETVARRNPGILDTVNDMLAPHLGELEAGDRARFDAALAGLKAAVAEHQTWLDTVLVPQAKGDFRLGPELYDEKMRFALQSNLTRADLKARATKSAADIRAQMYALSRKALAGRAEAPALPDNPTQAQQQAAIEAALALSYAQRPPRTGLMDKARETLAQATDFVRAKGFVWVPDTPIRIIEMPRSQWGYAVAYNDSPGALEKDQPNFYAIAPIPPEWSDEQATSFLREYNSFNIIDVGVHEAMPGHYVQIWHSNRYPSVLRAVLGSGTFTEGWAVYAEEMMVAEGFRQGDPLYKLSQLKMQLRSMMNAIIDQAIHVDGIDQAETMRLLTQVAFQEEREAAGKWRRAQLSFTQLSTYFVGYQEHLETRAAAQAAQGAAFNLKTYHDGVLAFGSPPARYARALLLNEAI